MSVPLIIHIFGQTSSVGLIANLLIATIVPIAMLFALLAGLGGMFIPMIAGWIAWPAVIVLTYMLDMAGVLARVPHSFLQGIGLDTAKMLGLYAVVLFVTISLAHETKRRKSGIITDRTMTITATAEGASV
jgi:hypothetical protein